MGLPKLELPIHIIELPISKKKLQIRPFVIKEEGSILTTLESNNDTEVFTIFKHLISSCVIEEIDFDLDINDFFYLLLQIRMKSNGEVVEGSQQCAYCKKQTQFAINLENSIELKNHEIVENVVEVYKGLSVKVKNPCVSAVVNMGTTDAFNSSLDVVASSIDTVIFEDKVYTDFTVLELKENILSNLTQSQFQKIINGIENLAKVVIKSEFICNNCGEVNEEEISDLANFV